MSSAILFEDIFDVRQMNPDGKKFERVNRLHGRGSTYDVDLVLDVNAELFEVRAGDRTTVAIASTLSPTGAPDDGLYNPNPGPSLADLYEYVMFGRIFKIEHRDNQGVDVLASFGGLLMKLSGEQSQLDALKADSRIYILMRRVD